MSENENAVRRFLRQYMREPMSAITHVIALIFSIVGLVILIVETLQVPDKLATMIIYGLSLVLSFGSSVALHWIIASRTVQAWLARLDHAAIYLLIAGSYTAVCYNTLDGFWRWGLLLPIWLIAVLGIAYKLSFFSGGQSNWLSTGSYLVMGWLAVVAMPEIIRVMRWEALLLIIAGGLAYSIGTIFFSLGQRLDRSPELRPFWGPHEWWHLFVMGGSFLHFLAVWLYIVPA